ncbi:hypothetical protein [Cedecea sp. NFIX57]|uniref:hypothetical protein n=1 Tax=Cedecea sp. NFIX57 TaxID=1566286 RepID=UPI000A0B40DC|nr:hypothetical protein [Cedecea sp. NFIX57]SMG61115.1 hypothetical protein SAMN03159353_10436 [Cedecea sp. NFIX57]
MKLNLLRNCIFCLVSLSGTGQATSKDIITEVYVNSIYSAIRQEWTVLENVCDTHVHRKLRLIVTDNHNAWAIDSKSLTKLPYSEKQRHLPFEYMHCMKIQGSGGRPTISASLGATLPPERNARFQTETKPAPALFNVATHEAFHFFVPANVWKKYQQIMIRGQHLTQLRLPPESIWAILFGLYILLCGEIKMDWITCDFGLTSERNYTQMMQATSGKPIIMKAVHGMLKLMRKLLRKANASTHQSFNML